MKIVSVVGARPNFMKIAPIAKAIKKYKSIKHVLVHTGQHYDEKMSRSFFRQLGIPRPQINLEVGSGSHAQQTALVMMRFETVLIKQKPDVVLVVGDVNSTMACTLVAKKLCIPVAHVEAGLRSYDQKMPEEINRLVTDCLADVLFTTSQDADKNLRKEGVPASKIHFVGNVMIDTLLSNLKKAEYSKILHELNIKMKSYALVTLHRPSNVDDKVSLMKVMQAIEAIQKDIKVVFPVHPRTMKNIRKYLAKKQRAVLKNVIFIDPLGYFDFMHLMKNAKLVVTDSGGIQEETSVLGIPCLTARENTERPITISQGTNILVGTNPGKIVNAARRVIQGKNKKGSCPKFWDGKAAVRIVKVLYKLHRTKELRNAYR